MKILVIKPSSLGDVIHALPFLNAVKESFPESRIDWVISKNLKDIIEDNPLINKLIVFDKDSWKRIKNFPSTLSEISSLKKTLNSRHYDMVLDLQGLLRSGLIALTTPATTKIGFADAREGSRFLYDKKVPVNSSLHAVDKCLKIAKAIGSRVNKVKFPLYIDKTAKSKIKNLLGDINEYVVIVPSARWITKRWPAEYFSSLIKKIPVSCVITGSKRDKIIAQKIVALIKKGGMKEETESSFGKVRRGGFFNNIIDLCGKTDLKELTALIAGAKAVVSNDSGPMHIAAALDKPVIALFGPTDPAKTGPYGWQTNKKLKVLRADVPCSPCRKKKCKEFICMNEINVDSVFEALKEHL